MSPSAGVPEGLAVETFNAFVAIEPRPRPVRAPDADVAPVPPLVMASAVANVGAWEKEFVLVKAFAAFSRTTF